MSQKWGDKYTPEAIQSIITDLRARSDTRVTEVCDSRDAVTVWGFMSTLYGNPWKQPPHLENIPHVIVFLPKA